MTTRRDATPDELGVAFEFTHAAVLFLTAKALTQEEIDAVFTATEERVIAQGLPVSALAPYKEAICALRELLL